MNQRNIELEETQFTVIRDLMTDASARGDWLTLAEISECTEFGEASISAQLRHLRKPKFGGFRVEKRRREVTTPALVIGALSGAGNRVENNFAASVVAEIWPDLFGDVFREARPALSAEAADEVASAIGDLNLHAGGGRVCAPWEYRVFAQPRLCGDQFFEGSPRLAKVGKSREAGGAGDEGADHDDGGFTCG